MRMMTIAEILQAVRDAEAAQRQVDTQVGQMARLCAGRLREAGVSSWTLVKLKRELRNFNMHTSMWKED